MKNIISQIYWAIYRLFPRGKKAWTFKKGLEGLQKRKVEKNLTKIGVISKARKKLKQKKILAFSKGSSVVKPKKTDHHVIESVKRHSSPELDKAGLKITKTGKFKNA